MEIELSQKEIGWLRLALSAALKSGGGGNRLPGQPSPADYKGILTKLEKHRRRTMRLGK